nr:hypothetical protein [Streptomyces catenulae]
MLSARIHNSTGTFVQCLIFGSALLLFAVGCGKSNAVAAAVGAVVGVGLVAFGVRSLVKSLGYRRELRRVNGGG